MLFWEHVLPGGINLAVFDDSFHNTVRCGLGDLVVAPPTFRWPADNHADLLAATGLIAELLY